MDIYNVNKKKSWIYINFLHVAMLKAIFYPIFLTNIYIYIYISPSLDGSMLTFHFKQ